MGRLKPVKNDLNSRRFFQCNLCSKSFSYKWHLKQHFVSHTDKRPHACHIPNCGKSFKRKGGLTSHFQTHTKPHQCLEPGCGKRFSRRYDLTNHIYTHTDEKPHHCPKPGCGKKFAFRNYLTVHIRYHDGEKPYQCQHAGCDKQFSDSSNFARHRRTHARNQPRTMVKHESRCDQRPQSSDKVPDDYISESNINPPTSTQTTVSWPIYAYVPGQAMPESKHIKREATSFLDSNQQMHQYRMQDVSNFFVSQSLAPMKKPFPVAEHGNPGVATMNTNHYPSFQVLRGQSNVVEMAYSAQGKDSPINRSLATPTSWGQYPSIHEDPYSCTLQEDFYAMLHAMPNATAVKQQPMSQDTQQTFQQNEESNGHYAFLHTNNNTWDFHPALTEVATFDQLPAYGAGFDNIRDDLNVRFQNFSMQLANSRMETF